ncbi:hypothetical protein [Alteromonas flava]|uniref:hypothetical protein n=1 Tax=Alteromonas flava TaxID=2048003 RepID=UPI000C28254E|nr:hypothetical protein [Alteromonas flava]
MNLRTITFFLALCFVNHSNAALISIPYTGIFDESTVTAQDGLPAGDYDTIGGLADVAVFELLEGTNLFYGSVFGPQDNADVFTVEIAAGFKLVGASILWGTNLPGIPFTFPPQQGYLQQNTFGPTAATWYFEESSPTPEIFTISGLEGTQFGEASQTASSPALNVMEGIYSSLLDATGTCAQTYTPSSDGIGLVAECVEGIFYTLTFNVEALPGTPPPPSTSVSEPLSLGLMAITLLGLLRIRRA